VKQRKGFAAMDKAKQREIASLGGRAAHEQGSAHEWNRHEAADAGRKGGHLSRGGRGKMVEETDSGPTARPARPPR